MRDARVALTELKIYYRSSATRENRERDREKDRELLDLIKEIIKAGGNDDRKRGKKKERPKRGGQKGTIVRLIHKYGNDCERTDIHEHSANLLRETFVRSISFSAFSPFRHQTLTYPTRSYADLVTAELRIRRSCRIRASQKRSSLANVKLSRGTKKERSQKTRSR